ncbi:MAG: hypothetical protein LUD02_12390 [Tannerellaceae bacterium]|nr:hypothetical protein [Tannerellaceae bacterium]MCD8264839.1 hypothetical protein [Tannerellaceae bacterium]
MKSAKERKVYLEKRLLEENAFWSYEKDSCRNLDDRNLIKYVLIHLDIEDINLLFRIYPKSKIKKIWLEELVPQGDYLINMNLCFAVLYFNIKKPKQYLKSLETRHFNKLAHYG